MNNNYQANTYPGADSELVLRQQVLRNTYLLLALSMIPTAIGALVGMSLSFGFLAASPIMGSLLLLGGLYVMMFMIEKNKHSFTGIVLLMGFTFLMGVLLGPLLSFALRIPNGANLVLIAAVLTAAVFFVMSAIAFTTTSELNFVSSFLTIGAVVLFIAIIANVFLRMPGFHLMICGAFVIFSSLMILWQVSQLVRGGETSYVSATLTIYISLYNLFTSLLQIIMAFAGGDRR
jgi:modulator of FtsH protease